MVKETDDISMEEEGNELDLLDLMLRVPPIQEDNYLSLTTQQQHDVESKIRDIYESYLMRNGHDSANIILRKEIHEAYIKRSLRSELPSYFVALDANHGWMLYWLLNSQLIINSSFHDPVMMNLVSEKIKRNVVDEGRGGIAGGHNQIGHLAASYASILALINASDFETLKLLRPNIRLWLQNLKNPDGSFSMHEGGESDTRSTYSALVIGSLLNILNEDLKRNTISWLNLCQTYEGGFSGVPNTEAHGGYTFCALASYFILFSVPKEQIRDAFSKEINIESLTRWTVMRQYQAEGGLCGRTNKLVDACYSFWIGALFPMLEMAENTSLLFDREALKCFLLICAQDVERGGFKDKPGKAVDFYHTNYALGGLSITEHSYSIDKCDISDSLAFSFHAQRLNEKRAFTNPIHPIFGVPMEQVYRCRALFYGS